MKNPSQKLYIVMVGLPARGKSTIATRLKQNLEQDDLQVDIFNNGNLRRKIVKEDSSYPEFYDPENKEAFAIREQIAKININNAHNYTGNIAILDATHASKKRREMISNMLSDHPLLFVECINPDNEILEASILKKTRQWEFNHLSTQEAFKSFKERIAYYEYIYSPFSEEKNFIKFDSLNNQILETRITNDIPYFEQIRDILVTDAIPNLFLVRHGESYDNIESRIGGDAQLTQKGWTQAKKLGGYFAQIHIPYIFCSEKQRTLETAEPVQEKQQDKCSIISLQEFNEINAGICEGLTYSEIKGKLPEVYYTRMRDKYNYIYPRGEGYVTMGNRIDKGLKKALFLSGHSPNIMIIAHRATNRMILAHFLYRRIEDVPYIFVPQDRYYHIISTQQKKMFELKNFFK